MQRLWLRQPNRGDGRARHAELGEPAKLRAGILQQHRLHHVSPRVFLPSALPRGLRDGGGGVRAGAEGTLGAAGHVLRLVPHDPHRRAGVDLGSHGPVRLDLIRRDSTQCWCCRRRCCCCIVIGLPGSK